MGLANLHSDSEITECVFAVQRSSLNLICTSTLMPFVITDVKLSVHEQRARLSVNNDLWSITHILEIYRTSYMFHIYFHCMEKGNFLVVQV